MSFFPLSNRKTRYIGLGTLVALITLMSIMGTFHISKIEKELRFIEVEHRTQLQEVDNILAEFMVTRGLLTSFVIEEETDVKPLLKRVATLAKNSESLTATLHRGKHQELMKQFTQKLKEYRTAMVAYSQELLFQRTGEGVRSWEMILLETEHQAYDIVTNLKNSIREEISQHQASIIGRGGIAKIVSIILGIIGILSGIATAFLLQRALSRPIQKLVNVSKAVAAGDLNQKIQVETNDEIGQLGTAFNKMTEDLSKTLVSKDYLDSIIQSIADILIVADLQGRIKTVNQVALSQLGYSKDEMIGMETRTVFAKSEGEEIFYRFMDKLIKEGHVTGYETTCETRALKRIPIILSGSVMKVEGKISDIVIIAKDITDRKQIEAELKRSRIAAEETSKLKSEFLANMSHEIRTPMNAIIGMTALAIDTELTAEQHDYLNTVQKSAYALLNIVNDILDFSKIEAGKLSIDNIDFNLRVTVEGAADTLAPQASEKGLELACLVHHNVPSLLRGDPARIRQVLLNFGNNAIKFTHKGEVIIRAEPGKKTHDKVTVLFSVTDTGVGIPEEKQEIIFDEFMQVDGSTTRMSGGTGLGLSISEKLVKMMGGEIGVKSEMGKGSRFWFTVTLEKQKEEEVVTEEIFPDIKGMRVLVADDNKTNRTILVKMLESFGCRAKSVSGGAKAIKLLKMAFEVKDPFRVLLLDMMMPGIDGEHTSIIIKNTPEIRDTLVIILTSLGSQGDVSRMRAIGCDGYLVKPVKQSLLLDTITTVINGRVKEAFEDVVTHHTIMEKKFQNIHILLVEDNLVNQKMVATMLKKAGYTVNIAENGRLGVEATNKNRYDLIFMDIQMPEMDGYEATKAIRLKEGDREHTAIIAMTAHAMQEDRRRCMEAGMDDFLSKPIDPQKMFNIIKKWVKSKIEASSSETVSVQEKAKVPGEVTEDKSPVDIKSAMSRFNNNKEFFKEMVREFLNYVPEQIRALGKAAKSGDAAAVQKNAHSIKGAAGNLSATRVFSTAISIEKMGRDGDISDVPSLIAKLKSEISCLEQFIENL